MIVTPLFSDCFKMPPTTEQISAQSNNIRTKGYAVVQIKDLESQIRTFINNKNDARLKAYLIKNKRHLFQRVVRGIAYDGDEKRYFIPIDEGYFDRDRDIVDAIHVTISNYIKLLNPDLSLSTPSILMSLKGVQSQTPHADFYGSARRYKENNMNPALSCIIPISASTHLTVIYLKTHFIQGLAWIL